MKKFYSIITVILFSLSGTFAQLTFTSYTNLNDVSCQLEVGDNIWFGGAGGIMVRNKSNGAVVATHTTNNGLPNNIVRDMTKDLSGNIWAVTAYGIAVFDGQQWLTFNARNSDMPMNIDRNLTSIQIDFQGHKWIGTTGLGAIEFDGLNWTMHNSYTTSNPSINDTINDIAINSSGYIWLATNNNAYIYTGTIWKKITGFKDSKLSHIIVDPSDSLWVTYANVSGVTRFKATADVAYVDYLNSEPTRTLNFDSQGRIWVTTENNGVFVIDKGDDMSEHYQTPNLISPRVFAVTPDAQGNMWFGTPDGVTKFNGTDWISYVNGSSLSANDVRDVVKKGDNDYFFATNFGLTQKSGPSWTTYMQGGLTDIPHNVCNTVEIVNDQFLWVGTIDGAKVLNLNAPATGWKPNTPHLDNIQVNDLSLDTTTGNMLAATQAGLHIFSGTWTSYNMGNSDLPSNTVNCVKSDADGNIWCGTDMGLAMYDNTNWTIYTISDGLPDNNINSIDFDIDGNPWIGTSNGLVSKVLSVWTVFDNSNSPIKVNDIQSVKVDDLGLVWIGTPEGFYVFNHNKWAEYTIEDGLCSDFINNIYQPEDTHERWVVTNSGVSSVNFETPQAKFVSDTLCYGLVNQISNINLNAGKIDSAAYIEWDILNDGSVDYTSWDVQHNFMIYGIYPVKLMIHSYYRHDTIIKNVIVGTEPDPVILPGSSAICDGNEIILDANILNYDTNFIYQYQWSNGEVTPSITVTEADTFSVIVKNFKCSLESPEIIVDVIEPYDSVEICMVTVDSATNKNMIMWERPAGREDIVSFNVYKVLGTNFIPVGEVLWDNMTKFIDFQSTPSNVSARYALTVMDTCGNESALSPYHQTIHLGASVGASAGTFELDWNHYEDESGNFVPDFYYIFRGDDAANLHLVQQVDGINTSYTDDNPTEERYYKISVNKPTGCLLSDTKPLKANAGPFSRSLSNLEDNRQQASDIKQFISGKLNVYPNPMVDKANVSFSNTNNNSYTLRIFNMSGEVVQIQNDITSSSIDIHRGSLESGMYFIELRGDKVFNGKLIVE